MQEYLSLMAELPALEWSFCLQTSGRLSRVARLLHQVPVEAEVAGYRSAPTLERTLVSSSPVIGT